MKLLNQFYYMVIGKLNTNNILWFSKELNHGRQLKLASGVTVNIYTTGKVVVQGKQTEADKIRNILGLSIKE